MKRRKLPPVCYRIVQRPCAVGTMFAYDYDYCLEVWRGVQRVSPKYVYSYVLGVVVRRMLAHYACTVRRCRVSNFHALNLYDLEEALREELVRPGLTLTTPVTITRGELDMWLTVAHPGMLNLLGLKP